jgi:hypothetical protein
MGGLFCLLYSLVVEVGQLTIVVDKMIRPLQADVNKEDLTASHCRNEFLQLEILLFLLIFDIHTMGCRQVLLIHIRL